MSKHRSTAWPLALALVALVLYASVYPFVGWRWPAGLRGAEWLTLPWPKGYSRFDDVANFLGYVPLGALLYLASVRSGGSRLMALALALAAPAVLSYTVELTQQFLPQRVPSLKDCLLNVGGASAGAAMALAAHAAGYVDRWQGLRERWFERDSAAAFLLLLLWPIALLFPAPAPLALGQIWGEVQEWILAAMAGTPWADEAAQWLGAGGVAVRPLSNLQEALILVLGLWAPCFVAYAITRAGWHRLLLLAGALLVAVAMMTMSSVLNFSAAHAAAWWQPHTGPALLVAAAVAAAAAGLGARWAAGMGVLALAFLVALVAQAPTDPYFAASVAGWEQGRFARFYGIAQWVGWLWPYAAMAWLLSRLARRSDGR